MAWGEYYDEVANLGAEQYAELMEAYQKTAAEYKIVLNKYIPKDSIYMISTKPTTFMGSYSYWESQGVQPKFAPEYKRTKPLYGQEEAEKWLQGFNEEIPAKDDRIRKGPEDLPGPLGKKMCKRKARGNGTNREI